MSHLIYIYGANYDYHPHVFTRTILQDLLLYFYGSKKKQKAATAPETLLFFVVILYIKKYQFAVKINVSDREL